MVKVYYLENGRNKVEDKGKQGFLTDVAKEYRGYEEMASPSDLLTSALITCVMSTIEVKASMLGLDISGFYAEGDKVTEGNKIKKFEIDYHLPENIDEDSRVKLERVAKTCFVGHQLDPSIEKDYRFIYDLKK